jgi:hypothetical protein
LNDTVYSVPKPDTPGLTFKWTSAATAVNQVVDYYLLVDTVGANWSNETKIQLPAGNDTVTKIFRFDMLMQMGWMKYPAYKGDQLKLQWGIKAVSTYNGITENEIQQFSNTHSIEINDVSVQAFFINYPTNDTLITLAGDRYQTTQFYWENFFQ